MGMQYDAEIDGNNHKAHERKRDRQAGRETDSQTNKRNHGR